MVISLAQPITTSALRRSSSNRLNRKVVVGWHILTVIMWSALPKQSISTVLDSAEQPEKEGTLLPIFTVFQLPTSESLQAFSNYCPWRHQMGFPLQSGLQPIIAASSVVLIRCKGCSMTGWYLTRVNKLSKFIEPAHRVRAVVPFQTVMLTRPRPRIPPQAEHRNIHHIWGWCHPAVSCSPVL